MTSNGDNTACACNCSTGFTGTTCNTCGVGYTKYPTCRLKTRTSSVTRSDQAGSIEDKTRSPSVSRSDHVDSMEHSPTILHSTNVVTVDESATPKPTRTRSSRAFSEPRTNDFTPTSRTISEEKPSFTAMRPTVTVSTRSQSDPAASGDGTETLRPSKTVSKPLTAEKMLVSYSSTMERSVNRTETRVRLIPTPIEELTPTEKAVTTTVSVATSVTAVLAPAALASLQTTVLFDQMPCMQPKVRDMAKTNAWTLSPLAAWCPAIVGSHEANMIMWNIVLLSALAGLHCAISRFTGVGEERLMYPYLSLSVATLLYQGSTFAAYRSLFQTELVYIPLTIATLGMSIGLPIWIWWCLQATGPIATRLKWINNHFPIAIPDPICIPDGAWGPPDLVATHGLLFNEFNDKGRWFKIAVLAYGHLIALTTSALPTSSVGCTVQVAACAVLTISMALIYAILRPLRWPIMNGLRTNTLVLQFIQLLMSVLEVHGTPEEVVATLIMISCLLEGIIGAACAGRDWSLYEALHATGLEVDEANLLGAMDAITENISGNKGGFSDVEEVHRARPPPPKFVLIDDVEMRTAPVFGMKGDDAEIKMVRPPKPVFEMLNDDHTADYAPPEVARRHAASVALPKLQSLSDLRKSPRSLMASQRTTSAVTIKKESKRPPPLSEDQKLFLL